MVLDRPLVSDRQRQGDDRLGRGLGRSRGGLDGQAEGVALDHAGGQDRRGPAGLGWGQQAGGYGLLLAAGTVDELIYGEFGNEVLLIKYVDSASAVR